MGKALSMSCNAFTVCKRRLCLWFYGYRLNYIQHYLAIKVSNRTHLQKEECKYSISSSVCKVNRTIEDTMPVN